MAAIRGALYFMFLAPPPSDNPGSDAVLLLIPNKLVKKMAAYRAGCCPVNPPLQPPSQLFYSDFEKRLIGHDLIIFRTF